MNRFLNQNLALNRGFFYLLFSILSAAAFALIVSGVGLIFGQAVSFENPFLMGLSIFVLALLVDPTRKLLQKRIDALLFSGVRDYQVKIQAFNNELSQLTDFSEILVLLRRSILDLLAPEHMHIFVFDSSSKQYIAAPDENGQNTTDITFSLESPLIEVLSTRKRSALYLRDHDSVPGVLLKDRARLALLDPQIIIPLPGQSRLVGWISLSANISGKAYQDKDVYYLSQVGALVSSAIERAQVISDLERRVHEMDVLTRIAQGINIKVNFDDVLELIFAQTGLLIPFDDFAILLREPDESDILYYPFYLQNNERIPEKENRPIPEGRGLERLVLENQQELRIDDYEYYCRSQGVQPTWEGIYSWMAVPLNAGTSSIGIISLGNRDSSFVYTGEHLRLLQTVADQAAGAIVKARLLEETVQRARQLSLLNELSRVLGSTLDLEPLLKKILDGAVEILNCQAGTLFLVDDESGELIFKVTAGPVAEDLRGKRLPPDTGLVGKAVSLKSPLISNDVSQSTDWYRWSDEQTGFKTESLLVVPMVVQDQVVGVIEVINKRTGMPFIDSDKELISAFASQAAVAYESARLYTMTDQALAERVEELSVMQRIDRQLNTSLDIERALRITLEWALRQSGADAGFIGMVEENGIRITSYHGYTGGLNLTQGGYLAYVPQLLQLGVQSGEVQWINEQGSSQDGDVMTGLAGSQIVIPIRREIEVIGVLSLESKVTNLISEDTLAFLIRLGDHASIAISNAQLYYAVQEANQAKSEFISMVSHELKTPMTSIRGYTDLLSAKSVGPVNEAQFNFLSTIRSNVERMQSLVNDLADVARIEAGKLRLEYRAFSISEIIDEVVRTTQTQILQKNQNLILQVPDDLPLVWGDRGRTIQVIANLLSNASKYSPEDATVTISAETSDNVWDLNGAARVLHITVQDSGYGISEEDKKKIFQKFFRADDQEIRSVSGTGLGLSIAKYLVEMQGGQIWFDSQLRQGTSFNFTLPIAEQ